MARERSMITFDMTPCPACDRNQWSCAVEGGRMVRRCCNCGHIETKPPERMKT